ncbi:AtpZ/AtpI family protein [Paenibacillus humicola]|uniref:AtpZ/AtpI family protein n=1 Tax=Paenibacillus humicola TaxID=3110540 RepID=UPI00237AD937|nr:AtpZ/AtpI family protein [Paenibacillus humicola]
MGKATGPWKAVGLVGLIGADLAFTTVGGFLVGRAIDRAAGTEPAFLIVGVLVGLGVGIYSITKLVKPFLGDG